MPKRTERLDEIPNGRGALLPAPTPEEEAA
jgi:hypothetical protein